MATVSSEVSASASASITSATSVAESILSTASSLVSAATSIASSTATSASQTAASSAAASQTTNADARGQKDSGIGIVSFIAALAVALITFAVQLLMFLFLRNKLARIFKPKTYLVPERERTSPPPRSFMGMIQTLFKYNDREIIDKCGLDAYFFLRYLKTLLIIFIPICGIVMPILIPMNYVGGKGKKVDINPNDSDAREPDVPTGLDTLAFGNVHPRHTSRYAAHLLMAILVVIWVCGVFFFELKVYIKVRQDYLTSAQHRLKASATTVLVSSIPGKWLSEEALGGLFDVFPGGVRNIWLNRDLSTLLEKISKRNKIHLQLEAAETVLIREAKKKQLKKQRQEEKTERKKMNLSSLTKKEKAARDAREDDAAKQMAEHERGNTAGDNHDVPHTVADGVQESRQEVLDGPLDSSAKPLPNSHGFIGLSLSKSRDNAPSRGSDRLRNPYSIDGEPTPRPSASETLQVVKTHSRNESSESRTEIQPKHPHNPPGRTVESVDEMYVKEETKWWQFWKPPSGAYISPVPQGSVAQEYMERKAKETKSVKSTWELFKNSLPFTGPKVEEVEYSLAYNPEYEEDKETPAVWEGYLRKKDRPTHHLPLFGQDWLFGMPLFCKKVDTIYWCREELARLNLEIEEDQKHPERFPLLSSAFVQFNHQVAAHMACQSVIHHIPKQMAPRINEISPRDVIWENMAFNWWKEWIRSALVFATVAAMVFFWAIPVAWTAALSQVDELIQDQKALHFIRDSEALRNIVKAIAGVLPALTLGLLLLVVPHILGFLANFKGVKTGSQRTEFVQVFYFVFLFIQVFLIVSIASFFAASLDRLIDNFEKLRRVEDVLNLLATNLPKAANYFFSYMILQALSTSSGTLLQIGALIMWFVVARIIDSTARNKWSRNTTLSEVRWGAFFPVYTNFACIALVYCVIAPLISVFAIITFGLLWLAQRYAMLYVNRFEHDTGGVLYPRAINQTFTGIYVMELCLAGLFFITKDENGKIACATHGAIMIVVLILTIIYQVLLNMAFAPLFRYLPITFEDEAVLRDEAFQRAQDRRLGIATDDDYEDEEVDGEYDAQEKAQSPVNSHGIEMRRFSTPRERQGIKHVGTWAKGGGRQLRKLAVINRSEKATEYRQKQRKADLEAQRAIGDALYGGFHDEIEDLTPEERDLLTRHAFQHEALRARRPTVWIPRDDLGISEDEIRRTQEYSEHIWISDEGTALDSKVRVVYGRHPPDFSEVDIINL